MLFSTLAREASFYSGPKLMWRLITGQLRISDCWVLNGSSVSHFALSPLQGSGRRQSGKTVRAGGWGGGVLWKVSSRHDMPGWYAFENSQTCGLPAQDRDSQHSILGGKGDHETPPLAEELLAVVAWEGVFYFQGCGYWQVAGAPVDGSIFMHMQAELTSSME